MQPKKPLTKGQISSNRHKKEIVAVVAVVAVLSIICAMVAYFFILKDKIVDGTDVYGVRAEPTTTFVGGGEGNDFSKGVTFYMFIREEFKPKKGQKIYLFGFSMIDQVTISYGTEQYKLNQIDIKDLNGEYTYVGDGSSFEGRTANSKYAWTISDNVIPTLIYYPEFSKQSNGTVSFTNKDLHSSGRTVILVNTNDPNIVKQVQAQYGATLSNVPVPVGPGSISLKPPPETISQVVLVAGSVLILIIVIITMFLLTRSQNRQ
jgi:hypothetical protein